MNSLKKKTAIVMSLAMASGTVMTAANTMTMAEEADGQKVSSPDKKATDKSVDSDSSKKDEVDDTINETTIPNNTHFHNVTLKRDRENKIKVNNVNNSGYFVVAFDKNDVKGYDIEERDDKKTDSSDKESEISFKMSTNSEYKDIKTKVDVPGLKDSDKSINISSAYITTEKDFGNYPVDRRDSDGDWEEDDDYVSFVVPFYKNSSEAEDAELTVTKFPSDNKDLKDVKARVYFVEYKDDDKIFYRVDNPRLAFINSLKQEETYRGVPFTAKFNNRYTYFTTEANDGASVTLDFNFENDAEGDIEAKDLELKVFDSMDNAVKNKSGYKDNYNDDEDEDDYEPSDTYTIDPSSGEDSVSFTWRKGMILRLETEDNNALAMKIKVSASGGTVVENNYDKPSKPESSEKPEVSETDSELADIFKNHSSRIEGSDRYETAAKVAKKFPSTDTAIIVSGENYPDAIAAGPLSKIKEAPILMVKKDKIPAATSDALEDMKIKKVIIVGGSSSISNDVFNKLIKDYKVERVEGKNRYETSVEIAKKIERDNDVKGIVVANGRNFADSLSITPVAGKYDYPIILVDKKLSAGAENFINKNKIENNIIAGGYISVSRAVENALEGKVERVSGYDRYATSAAIANKYFNSELEPYLASGENYPDSLAVGSLAAIKGEPLLLTKKNTLSSGIKEIIKKKVDRITIVGGYNSVGDMKKIYK